MDHVLGVVSKKASSYPKSSRFSPMSSYRSFIVLNSTFRSIIHFELIFLKDVGSVFTLSVLHADAQLFQHHLLKGLSFPYWIAFATWSNRDQLTIFMGLSLGSLFSSSLFVSFANMELSWLPKLNSNLHSVWQFRVSMILQFHPECLKCKFVS